MERLVEDQVEVVCEKESMWKINENNLMIPDHSNLRNSGSQWYDGNKVKYYSSAADIPDSAFHWHKNQNGWINKFTEETIESEMNPGLKILTLEGLSTYDWFTIARSFLLLTSSKPFANVSVEK